MACFGQQLKWMQYDEVPKKLLAHKIVSVDETGIYIFQANKKVKRIAKYTFGMQLITAKEIPLDFRIASIEHIEVTNSETDVFFSMYNESNEHHGLFSMRIPHAGQATLPPKNIIDQEGVLAKSRSSFDILTAKDQSFRIAVHFFENTKNESTYSVKYIQPNLDVISEKMVSIPSNTIGMELKQSILDPNGNVYSLFECTEKNKRQNDMPRHFFRLIRISKADLSYKIVDINDENIQFASAFMGLENISEKLIIAGFYTNNGSRAMQGSYLTHFQTDSLEFTKIMHQPFKETFLSKINAFSTEKPSKIPIEYDVKNMVVRTDGGAVLAAEAFYTTTQSYIQYSQGFPITRYITYYHFDEIVTISINPDGSIDWQQVIPKKQVSTSLSDIHSFSMARTPEKLWFIFHVYIKS